LLSFIYFLLNKTDAAAIKWKDLRGAMAARRNARTSCFYRLPKSNLMEQSPRVAVFRQEHFNAAHRLHNPSWTEERNREVFGKCNNPHYHGHNYLLQVRVVGPIDPETGYVIDMKVLSDLIKEQVLDRFDHKNLNLDVEEFKRLNPTAENIAVVTWNLIRKHLEEHLDLTVRLYETERNYVEYPVA
jgi:6-pyruvoyltetrahydropterin/6-carboxytetrahydropterin synthase